MFGSPVRGGGGGVKDVAGDKYGPSLYCA